MAVILQVKDFCSANLTFRACNWWIKKNMKKTVDSLATFVALKVLCNGILKLMGSQVTTEISGYKEVVLCMGGRGVL